MTDTPLTLEQITKQIKEHPPRHVTYTSSGVYSKDEKEAHTFVNSKFIFSIPPVVEQIVIEREMSTQRPAGTQYLLKMWTTYGFIHLEGAVEQKELEQMYKAINEVAETEFSDAG